MLTDSGKYFFQYKFDLSLEKVSIDLENTVHKKKLIKKLFSEYYKHLNILFYFVYISSIGCSIGLIIVTLMTKKIFDYMVNL
jgi:hypothetical protein